MKRFASDIKKYWGYMVYEARSQLKAEVANSYLNWIWWILEPFCLMMIYAFVFGFLFKHKEDNYNVFIFIALALWDNFNRCIRASVSIVRSNKSIVSKVYVPKFALIDAVIFTFGCCCVLAHIGVFVDDMANIITILLRFMFYLTGVFYNINTSIPRPYSTILLSCNPIALFVDALRNCILNQMSPDWKLMGIWLIIGLLLSAFGVSNIYKHENTYVKVI